MSSRELSGIVAECERLMVACLLATPGAWAQAGHIQPAEIADETLRNIYAAGLACVEAGEEPGPVEIGQRLANAGQLERCGGYPALLHMASEGAEREIGGYVWRVSHGSMMRGLAADHAELGRLLETATLEDAPKIRARMVELLMGEGAGPKRAAGMRSLQEVQREVVDLMNYRRANPGAPIGVQTGLPSIDRRWVAMEPGQMVVVGARPGMGKTAFAINIAMHATASSTDGWVCYFSAEVPDVKITLRTLSIGSGIGSRGIRTGGVTNDESYQVVSGMVAMSAWSPRLLLDDTPSPSPITIRRALRGVAKLGPLRLVIVDHMHLMEPPRQRNSEEREQAEISKGLLYAAKEFEVPMVALSQLNRAVDDRPDKRPVMRDLRGSGAIEQDADVIAFLYREDAYTTDKSKHTGLVDVISRKVREDEPGTDTLRFDPRTQRFSEELTPKDYTGASTHASRSHEPPERAPGWDDPSARGWHG